MQCCLVVCPAFLGLSPALQQRILDPLMNQFLSCHSFLPSGCTKADKHRQSEEAGWVMRNFWLGVTGKLFNVLKTSVFNVLKNSVCRSLPYKQGQYWQSRDAFLLQTLAARAGEGLLCAGRVSETSVVRVRMLNDTCLSHCSSVFVFRLFGGSDQGWLVSCFVLQQYKQSVGCVWLQRVGFILNFSCLEAGIYGGSLGALFQSCQWKWGQWSIDRMNRNIYTNPGSVLAPGEA